MYHIFTDNNRKRVFVPYDIVFHVVDENRERAFVPYRIVFTRSTIKERERSHASVPYFWVAREEKTSKVTLAVGRQGGC